MFAHFDPRDSGHHAADPWPLWGKAHTAHMLKPFDKLVLDGGAYSLKIAPALLMVSVPIDPTGQGSHG